jgi:hypothetical protein
MRLNSPLVGIDISITRDQPQQLGIRELVAWAKNTTHLLRNWALPALILLLAAFAVVGFVAPFVL